MPLGSMHSALCARLCHLALCTPLSASALCSRLCALDSMHLALLHTWLHTWLYALGPMHLALCTWLYALGSMHLALCAALCTWLHALGSKHLALCTWLYALGSMRCSMHLAPCTWLYALGSMHLALCTALCTWLHVYALGSMQVGPRAPRARTLRDASKSRLCLPCCRRAKSHLIAVDISCGNGPEPHKCAGETLQFFAEALGN